MQEMRVTTDPFGPEVEAFIANMRRHAQIPEATRARATAMMNRYLEAG